MMNPQIPLEMPIRSLPYGFSSWFDWEIEGVRHRYTVRCSGLYYIDSELKVFGDLRITKSKYATFWRWEIMRTVWSVETRSHVDFFLDSDIEREMVRQAAKQGIMPSQLLLDKAIEVMRRQIRPIRDGARGANDGRRSNALRAAS